MEWGAPGPGLALVLAAILLIRPRLMLEADWSLILVFALMFADIHLLTRMAFLQSWVSTLPHLSRLDLLMETVLTSQVISNVPATILLTQTLPPDAWLACAVNVGGFGLAPASLANLIALRISKERGIWLHFHYFSVPFLFISMLTLFFMGYLDLIQ